MRDTPSILPLAASGLTFEADGKRLLNGVDISIPRGERLALVGPNGAGKSLTLRFPRSEVRDRAQAALARFGLGDLAHRPARVLSGGEQQRLAITRAAALEPDLLFLDEPTSALDPGATRQVETMLDDLHGSGVTLVFSTHDLGQARRMARRVAFMHKGRVVEYGTTGQVLDAPQTAEARAFVAGDLLW